MPEIDPSFTALPYRELGEVALGRAQELGASHADFRFERIRHQHLGVRDGVLQTACDTDDLGFAVRVIHRGAWGFASGVVLTTEEAGRVAETAVAVAEVAAEMTSTPVEIAPEPVYDDVTWVSSYDVNPFDVPIAEKAALLIDWTDRLRTGRRRRPRHGLGPAGAGEQVLRRPGRHGHHPAAGPARPRGVGHGRRRRHLRLDADASRRRSGRGWEYLTGGLHDWDAELDEIPELLAEKLKAPTIEAGRYDLVIHPSNLWLTIHESIGHATELDRALGYEANYAGTSFATYDKLGTLQYGSTVMNVTGDRTVEHGLATIGYDDEGVQTQSWDIVRDGVLVGYQLDRPMGHMKPELNGGRSNGCAYADSPGHIPIQRMANVSLQPAEDGPSTEELIGRVERGLYVVGDKSWSIDMQRFNFQFTGQRFYRITDGELTGQVRDAAYQATTTDFWGSMEAVGGPQTWVLGGAFNCGKAQPGQVAAVSHGCPTSLFRDIRILNTTAGGRPMTQPAPAPSARSRLVEHALPASIADDCVAIVRDSTSANLRWANNTLTTNGVMHGVHVTRHLLRPAGRRRLGRLGDRQRHHPGRGRRPGPGRRRRGPARLAGRGRRTTSSATRTSPDWADAPGTTGIHVYDDVAPALGEAFGRAGARGPRALRLRQPRGDHDVPRLDHRPPAAARPAHRPLRAAPARPPT